MHNLYPIDNETSTDEQEHNYEVEQLEQELRKIKKKLKNSKKKGEKDKKVKKLKRKLKKYKRKHKMLATPQMAQPKNSPFWMWIGKSVTPALISVTPKLLDVYLQHQLRSPSSRNNKD